MSVRITSGVSDAIIQSSSTIFAVCGVVVLVTGIALVSFVYQLVMTIRNQLFSLVFVSGLRIWIATKSIVPDSSNSKSNR